MTNPIDLACFGYLSSGIIIKTDSYPSENSVARVSRISYTLAADAPIVTLLSAQLGIKSGLLSNAVGADENGRRLVQLLKHPNINTTIRTAAKFITPQMFIIDDSKENKTILTSMPNVQKQLDTLNMEIIHRSKLVYIDLYSEISEASLRIIRYATQKGIPVFINLSAFNLQRKIFALQNLKGITIIQASYTDKGNPSALANNILRRTSAEVALITLGSKGAYGANRLKTSKTPAFKVRQLETHHAAGAAFAAGYAFAHLNSWELERALEFACALASLTREAADGLGKFSVKNVLRRINQ